MAERANRWAMAALLAVGAMAALVLLGRNAVRTSQSGRVLQATESLARVLDLASALQQERERTARFLARDQQVTASVLRSARSRVDAELARFRRELQGGEHLPREALAHVQRALAALERLQAQRGVLELGMADPSQAGRFFDRPLDELLGAARVAAQAVALRSGEHVTELWVELEQVLEFTWREHGLVEEAAAARRVNRARLREVMARRRQALEGALREAPRLLPAGPGTGAVGKAASELERAEALLFRELAADGRIRPSTQQMWAAAVTDVLRAGQAATAGLRAHVFRRHRSEVRNHRLATGGALLAALLLLGAAGVTARRAAGQAADPSRARRAKPLGAGAGPVPVPAVLPGGPLPERRETLPAATTHSGAPVPPRVAGAHGSEGCGWEEPAALQREQAGRPSLLDGQLAEAALWFRSARRHLSQGGDVPPEDELAAGHASGRSDGSERRARPREGGSPGPEAG